MWGAEFRIRVQRLLCGFRGFGIRVPVSGFGVVCLWLRLRVTVFGFRFGDLRFGAYDGEAAEARGAGTTRVAELPQELQGEYLP